MTMRSLAAATVLVFSLSLGTARAETLAISTDDTAGWTYRTERSGTDQAVAAGIDTSGPKSITPGIATPAYWVARYTFDLTTLDSASLALNWLGADDRVALVINGVLIGGEGIYNATYYNAARYSWAGAYDGATDRVLARHYMDYGTTPAYQDVWFGENGATLAGITVAALTDALQVGTNVIELIVNNTQDPTNAFNVWQGGWSGDPIAGSPTWAAMSATLTYQVAAVPAPVAGAGLPALAVIGGTLLLRRRTRSDLSRA